MANTEVVSSESIEFEANCEGQGPGKGFRRLRDEELERLNKDLTLFSDEATKISSEEIEFKKELVKWLVKSFRNAIGGYVYKTFNTGSAYEKVQAGEAKDFDVMIFLHVRKWAWKVHDEPDKPGFCYITRGKERRSDNPNSFAHLLDSEGRLSSLKVRQLFTSKIDKFLRKNNPLTYEYKKPGQPETDTKVGKNGEAIVKAKSEGNKSAAAATKAAESSVEDKETYKVNVTRKYQGPATTLTIEVSCNGQPYLQPFTLDLVNSLHNNHIKTDGERCDFVAKPFDKQQIFSAKYEHLWRKSYSRRESDKFKAIDSGNQVHRKLLRIFKILRVNQSQLKLLKTYVFKNLLFHLSSIGSKEWNDEQLAHRFVDMIIALRNCLAGEQPYLPVFFNPKVNLLQESEYKKDKLQCVMHYLRRIANKGEDGYKALLQKAEKSEERAATAKLTQLQKAGEKRSAQDTEASSGSDQEANKSTGPKPQTQSKATKYDPKKAKTNVIKKSGYKQVKKSAKLSPLKSSKKLRSRTGVSDSPIVMGLQGLSLLSI